MLVYFEWTDTSTTNTWPAAQGVTGRWQDAIRGHRARSSGGRNTSTVVRVSGMQWPPLQSVSELNKPSKPTKRGKEQAKQEGHANHERPPLESSRGPARTARGVQRRRALPAGTLAVRKLRWPQEHRKIPRRSSPHARPLACAHVQLNSKLPQSSVQRTADVRVRATELLCQLEMQSTIGLLVCCIAVS